MRLLVLGVSIVFSLFSKVSCEIDSSEYRNLYCVDPHTGIHYPAHSTWPSSTFCGTYTCNVRAISHRGDNSENFKSTFLQETLNDIDDDLNMLTNDVSMLNSNEDDKRRNEGMFANGIADSNPVETMPLYNAAKNLLTVLENYQSNEKLKDKMTLTKTNYNGNANKVSKIENKHNKDVSQFDKVLSAAKNLMVQMKDKLTSADELTNADVEDIGKLVNVSSQIDEITIKKINNKENAKSEQQSDPKLIEYMNQYNEYMKEYKNAYQDHLLEIEKEKSAPSSCDVLKSVVAEMNTTDCELSPSEMRQMFFFRDSSGDVKQLATPKHLNKSCIPGVYVKSDADFNYWNVEDSNLGHKRNKRNSDLENSNLSEFEKFKEELAHKCYCLYSLILPHTGDYLPQEKIQNTSCNQCSLSDMQKYIHEISHANITHINSSLSDPGLITKFHKAMLAYKEYNDYYVQHYGENAKTTDVDYEVSTAGTSSITTESSYILRGTTSIPTNPQQVSTMTQQFMTKTEEHTKQPPSISTSEQPKYDDETLKEMYSKLSYYSFDPNTNSYIARAPKDNEEYMKFLNEYNEVVNSYNRIRETTETPQTTTTKVFEVDNIDSEDFGLIAELLGFKNARKRWPSMRNKIKEQIMNKKSNLKVGDFSIEPVLGKLDNKETKENIEDKNILKKYDAIVKKINPPTASLVNNEDASPESSRNLDRILLPSQGLRSGSSRGLKYPFLNSKLNPVAYGSVLKSTPFKGRDVFLKFDGASDISNDFKPVNVDETPIFHPNIARKKRSAQNLRSESKKLQAYITVNGCPESLEPGYFSMGNPNSFYPQCCPQRIP